MKQNNSNQNNKKSFFTDNSPSIRNTPSEAKGMENVDFFKDFWGTDSYSYESNGKKYVHDSLGSHLARTNSQTGDAILTFASAVPYRPTQIGASIISGIKNIWEHGVGKGTTQTVSGEIFSSVTKKPILSQIANFLGGKAGSKFYDAMGNFNFKSSQSVPRTMKYNPTTLKYGMTNFSSPQKPPSESWQRFLNDSKTVQNNKYQHSSSANLGTSNQPVAGVANNLAVNEYTEMIATYMPLVYEASEYAWMADLGAILSGTASAISNVATLGAGFSGGVPTGTTPQAQLPYEMNVHGFPMYHSGGKVIPKHKGGRSEMMAILQGGETVRTEAQEKELQDSKMKEFMDAYTPLVSGENNEYDPYAQVFGQNNSQKKDPKIPVLANKTRHDEEMIIAIVADAWKFNRSGFRNILRYN